MHVTSDVGDGFPDIVVGRHGVNYMLQIKDGKKPPSARKLTLAEAKFHRDWRGHVIIVETIDEALFVVGIRKRGDRTCARVQDG